MRYSLVVLHEELKRLQTTPPQTMDRVGAIRDLETVIEWLEENKRLEWLYQNGKDFLVAVGGPSGLAVLRETEPYFAAQMATAYHVELEAPETSFEAKVE